MKRDINSSVNYVREIRKSLFSLRILAQGPFFRALLERGTGAPYISAQALESLPISTELADEFPSEFALFQSQALNRSSERLDAIAKHVFERIMRFA
jgi:hypothetical protein